MAPPVPGPPNREAGMFNSNLKRDFSAFVNEKGCIHPSHWKAI